MMRSSIDVTSESQEDESPDGENEDTINAIRTRIADALVNSREL